VDRVFCDLGLEVGWYVFDDAGAGATGSFQLAAAVGTFRQFMLDFPVDPFGLVAGMAVVAGFRARLFAAFALRQRLLEWWRAAGRGVGCAFGGDGGGQLQEQEAGFAWVAVEKLLGLCLAERAGAEGVQERGIEFDSRKLFRKIAEAQFSGLKGYKKTKSSRG
jgi:hypothetical protein